LSYKYSNIKERQEIVEELCQLLNGSSKPKDENHLPEGDDLSDEEIEEIIGNAKSANNGEKFSKLFDGEWEECGYQSQSEADLAFCNILVYWTNSNPTGIDQIFRESGLYRDKWDRKDYRENTIKKALEAKNQQAKDDFKDVSDKETASEGFPIIHIADVESAQVEFQIDKIWPINSVGFMSGQPGVCKSWLAWEIAVCIASGTKLFGLHGCRKGKVLAFNAEDDPAMTTKARIEAIASHKGLNIRDLDLNLLDIPSVFLDDKDAQKRFEISVSEYRPDFIILDPLRNIHALDEDKATDMSAKLLHYLREINREYSCSILLVCHDKKPSKGNGQDRASQVRGTSALVGWRDVAVFLDKESDGTTDVELYNRSCRSIQPFSIELVTNSDDKEQLITANLKVTSHEQIENEKEQQGLNEIIKIIADAKGPISRNKVREKAGMNKKKCLDLIKILLDFGDIEEMKKKLVISNRNPT
jgi:hypothetical protein